MGRQYLVRYTLQRIEQALHPALEKMVDVSTLVHIEHVMPQTLNKEWSANLGSFADQHQEYVNRWGNLTLLFAGLNIPASNKVFEQKTRYYGDSQVRITQELCQYGTWGPEQIDARQRWLAEVAESIWRVDPVPHDQLPALRYEHKTSLDDFRERVGALWPAIEPYATDTTAQEIRSLATRLPAHLAGHAEHSSLAGKIADGLTELLQGWEGYSHSDRRFVRAVAEYFLEPEDSVPDELPGGLEDDRTALVAAFAALDRQVPSYLQS
ncbi:GmrSD restriction endonuclease domain-containing protein [Actinopolymorpha cephalotaxi]